MLLFFIWINFFWLVEFRVFLEAFFGIEVSEIFLYSVEEGRKEDIVWNRIVRVSRLGILICVFMGFRRVGIGI